MQVWKEGPCGQILGIKENGRNKQNQIIRQGPDYVIFYRPLKNFYRLLVGLGTCGEFRAGDAYPLGGECVVGGQMNILTKIVTSI